VGTAALLSIAAATLPAAPPPPAAAAAACSSSPAAALRAAASAAPGKSVGRARVSDRTGTRGQFIGRQIDVTPATGPGWEVDLPAESFVSEVVGNALVYTRFGAGRSEVRALELSTGCDYAIAQPAGTVRSAVIDPKGEFVYVHSVSTAGRADAGVIRYGLTGGVGSLVLKPLPSDPRYGPTFGTKLAWSDDGANLIVQSCGFEACRTRLLEVASGSVEMIDSVPHGDVVGITPSHLVAFAACHWSPCDLISIERQGGAVSVLADDALAAEINGAGAGSTVMIETTAGSVEVLP
jgi:hypothetical protein